MNKQTLFGVASGIGAFVIVVLMGMLILSNWDSEEYERQAQLTYDKCCGGVPCTDTYYDEETNECKSTVWIPYSYANLWLLIGIVLLVSFVLMIILYLVGKNATANSRQTQLNQTEVKTKNGNTRYIGKKDRYERHC